MMESNKTYVVGKERVPEWVNEQSRKGRIRLNYEDGELVNAVVRTVAKTYTAYVGDVVMFLKSGLTVVTAERAQKYMGRKNEQKAAQ